MEVTFARAMDRNKVMKLRDLNAGFTRPDTISLAYYQASLLVDHIVATKGQAALNALVKSYADGIDNDAALQRALNVNIDTLAGELRQGDRGAFRRRCAARCTMPTSRWMPARWIRSGRRRRRSLTTTWRSSRSDRRSRAAGDAAAYAPLQRAAALVPSAIGPESPHALMAQLAEKLNDRPRAIKEYGGAARRGPHRRRRGAQADGAGDGRGRRTRARAWRSTASSRWIRLTRRRTRDPGDSRSSEAITWSRGVSSAPRCRPALADKAAAHCDLGESYLLAGMRAEAKKEALAALEIAPSFERAQELLLNAVGGQAPGARAK